MAGPTEAGAALQAWLAIPASIEKAIEGLAEQDLDLRGGADGWSIRENVHHVVEASLVASNIVLACLAKSGCVYDWSWVTPDSSWVRRVGYDKAPVPTAIDLLKALCTHMALLITSAPDGFSREVQLLDAPGAKLYTRTVKDLLTQEVEHAEGHLSAVTETRAGHAR